mgnify:CR=1 FL=1
MKFEKSVLSRDLRSTSGRSLGLCLALLGITPACGTSTTTDDSATNDETSAGDGTDDDTGDDARFVAALGPVFVHRLRGVAAAQLGRVAQARTTPHS